MNQELFDLSGTDDDTPIDVSLLTDDGRTLYQGLCKMVGVQSLPSNSNEKEINRISDKSYYKSFAESLKKWLTPSLKERIIKGVYDYMLLLRKLTAYTSRNAAVNKDVYSARFNDPGQFHKYHKGNSVYDILYEFMLEGGAGIDNHLKEIDDIINEGFSVDETKDAIENCKKKGNIVYNIKYLHSILKRIKENEELDRKRWEREKEDGIVCIESLRIEEVLNQRELDNKRDFSDEELTAFNKILSLKENNDKTET